MKEFNWGVQLFQRGLPVAIGKQAEDGSLVLATELPVERKGQE
jgi:hypothetical protein